MTQYYKIQFLVTEARPYRVILMEGRTGTILGTFDTYSQAYGFMIKRQGQAATWLGDQYFTTKGVQFDPNPQKEFIQ